MEENGGVKGPGMEVDEIPGGGRFAGDGGEALGSGDGVVNDGSERKGAAEMENEEEEEEEEATEKEVFMDEEMGRRQDVKEEVVDGGAKAVDRGARAGDDAEARAGDDANARTERSMGHVAWEKRYDDGDVSGTEEEQHEFRKEVEGYYKQRGFEFRAPKFYKEELNLLK